MGRRPLPPSLGACPPVVPRAHRHVVPGERMARAVRPVTNVVRLQALRPPRHEWFTPLVVARSRLGVHQRGYAAPVQAHDLIPDLGRHRYPGHVRTRMNTCRSGRKRWCSSGAGQGWPRSRSHSGSGWCRPLFR